MVCFNNIAPLLALDMLVVVFISLFIQKAMAGNEGQLKGEELIADDGKVDDVVGQAENTPTTKNSITEKEDPHQIFTTEKPIQTTKNGTFPIECKEQCKDLYESCARRKHYCDIAMYHKMMTKVCPLTCERCKKHDDCFDLRKRCIQHRCTRERFYNEMQVGCAKTCKFCVPFTCPKSQ